MSLSQLSLEIVQEISSHIHEEHKSLRTVNRAFNFAIAPTFFASVRIHLSREDVSIGPGILDALATGSTMWSGYAQTLQIVVKDSVSAVTRGPNLDSAALAPEDWVVLKKALHALPNIRFVRWECDALSLLLGSTQVILDFLGSLANFEQLDFCFKSVRGDAISSPGPTAWTFSKFLGLRKLKFSGSGTEKSGVEALCRTLALSGSTDKLSHLELDRTRAQAGDKLPELLRRLSTSPTALHLTHLQLEESMFALNDDAIEHLRSLKSLSLEDGFTSTPESHSRVDSSWKALTQARIHLSELRLQDLDDGAIAYLSSYEGLELLSVASAGVSRFSTSYADADSEDEMTPEHESESDKQRDAVEARRAHAFFGEVLPLHALSLWKLSLKAACEGRWSFAAHNAAAFARLENLHTLVASIDVATVARTTGTGGGGSGRGSQPILEVKSDPVDGMNSVDRFLTVINALPKLRRAAVLPTIPLSLCHSRCGNPIISHKQRARRALEAAFGRFIGAVPSTSTSRAANSELIVFAGDKLYYKRVIGMKGDEEALTEYRVLENLRIAWPYSFTPSFVRI
ncbi:hypothetical protein C8F01DRAFT_749964 [Mycena amicta]|nr:hypothetical protein C8F01DRAFT_749964 [Mycena amicta]